MRRSAWLAALICGLLPFAPCAVAGPDPLALEAQLHRNAIWIYESPNIRHRGSPAATAAARAGTRPATYYVDARRGRDSNSGTTPLHAWRTIARVNGGSFRGSDRILFTAGQKFFGTLRLGRGDLRQTSPRALLTIGSYGQGRATLVSVGSGVIATNVSGVRITAIDIAGRTGSCRSATDGILFDARGVHGSLRTGIFLEHVEVHGFCDGVVIGSEDDGSRIDHVRISDVVAHDNGGAGVITYDPARKHHDIRDVSVVRTRAYRNSDQGGIVLFGVEHGVVEHSVAFDNGRGHAGDVGIWAFDSDRILIAHNESYGNMTNGDDGDGFDLDGGVTNSVMEHNYAHDDQGIGFLICACVGYWYPQRGDIVAHNVSIDDGSSGQTSGMYVGGGAPFHDVQVYSNSFYSDRGAGPLVSVDGAFAPYANVHVHNNVFVEAGRKSLLYADTADARNLTFSGDHWLSCSGDFLVRWGSRRFASLTAWQRTTGAERGGTSSPSDTLCSPSWWRASADTLRGG